MADPGIDQISLQRDVITFLLMADVTLDHYYYRIKGHGPGTLSTLFGSWDTLKKLFKACGFFYEQKLELSFLKTALDKAAKIVDQQFHSEIYFSDKRMPARQHFLRIGQSANHLHSLKEQVEHSTGHPPPGNIQQRLQRGWKLLMSSKNVKQVLRKADPSNITVNNNREETNLSRWTRSSVMLSPPLQPPIPPPMPVPLLMPILPMPIPPPPMPIPHLPGQNAGSGGLALGVLAPASMPFSHTHILLPGHYHQSQTPYARRLPLLPPDALPHETIYSEQPPAIGLPSFTSQALGLPRFTLQAVGLPRFTSPAIGSPSFTSQAVGSSPRFTSQAIGSPRFTLQAVGSPSFTSPAIGSPSFTLQAVGSPRFTSQAVGSPRFTSQAVGSESRQQQDTTTIRKSDHTKLKRKAEEIISWTRRGFGVPSHMFLYVSGDRYTPVVVGRIPLKRSEARDSMTKAR